MKKHIFLTVVLLIANIVLLAVIVNGFNERRQQERMRRDWERGVDWYLAQKTEDGGNDSKEQSDVTEETVEENTENTQKTENTDNKKVSAEDIGLVVEDDWEDISIDENFFDNILFDTEQ